MAQLAAEAGRPAVEPPVDDDAAAHARPQREQDERARAASGAPGGLAEGERVHVIVHRGGHPERAREEARHRHAAELGHIVGLAADGAGGAVDDAGHARADAGDPVSARPGQPRHLGGQGQDPRHRVAASASVSGAVAAHHHAPRRGHQPRRRGGAAHVDAEEDGRPHAGRRPSIT
jgi:hypothetical protein